MTCADAFIVKLKKKILHQFKHQTVCRSVQGNNTPLLLCNDSPVSAFDSADSQINTHTHTLLQASPVCFCPDQSTWVSAQYPNTFIESHTWLTTKEERKWFLPDFPFHPMTYWLNKTKFLIIASHHNVAFTSCHMNSGRKGVANEAQ